MRLSLLLGPLELSSTVFACAIIKELEDWLRRHFFSEPAAAMVEKPHTLEEFSYDHFRAPPKKTLSKTLSLSTARRKDKDCLWKHTKDPIRQPLLKRVAEGEVLVKDGGAYHGIGN